jgi:hypothetical protein
MAFLRLEYSIKAGFVKGYYVVTYPPNPLPLLFIKGKGEYFIKRGFTSLLLSPEE